MTAQSKLELHFSNLPKPELFRTTFKFPGFDSPIHGLRGHSVPPGHLPFRWSPALHGLSFLFAKSALNFLSSKHHEPLALGYRSCIASCVATLFYKRTDSWAFDLFGTDANGKTLLSKLFRTYNYHLTRPIPMQIYFRSSVFSPSQIKIIVDGKPLCTVAELESLTKALEATWSPGINKPRQKDPSQKVGKKETSRSPIRPTR